jgi:hypothetical protein
MRLSFFILLFSFNALAQIDTGNGSDGACTEVTPALLAGGTLNCATLIISASPAFNPNASALIIKVQGLVSINAALDLSGGDGINSSSISGVLTPGGSGGPGAGDGGGTDGVGSLDSGSDASVASGDAADLIDVDCGDGGGGAGFIVAGTAGTPCPLGPSLPGNGGAIVPTSEFSLSGPFRGGYGGGAGADSGDPVLGPGGGGGGGIHILAGGDVTITALGSIIAVGGDGGAGTDGAALTDSGGGGGGSGGAIWIQTLGQINHAGNMNADGGTGGVAPAGGTGGNGGRGLIRLEDLDGVISGGGTLPGYTTVDSVIADVIGSSSLKSDISCGTIKPAGDEDHSHFFQLIMGFLLVMTASFFINRLKFFSKTQV